MPKRKRSVKSNQEKINENIEKIKECINKKKSIYDQFLEDTKMHNLVIEKVKEKLATDVLPADINHFNGILRNRYHLCSTLLHDASNSIKELDKIHYSLVSLNGDLDKN